MGHSGPDSVNAGALTGPLGEVGDALGADRAARGASVSAPLIRAADVERWFGERRALPPVSFVLDHQSTTVVTGANGSGKTTLLRLIAGLAAPTRGLLEVAIDRSRVGYLGHEPLLYNDLTPDENLGLFARLYRVPDRARRVAELLDTYGLHAVRNERVGSFSRGMTQRVAICRAVLHRPTLLVLDEPHTALDTDGSALLDAQLAELARNVTLVVATHEPHRLDRIATGQIVLGAP